MNKAQRRSLFCLFLLLCTLFVSPVPATAQVNNPTTPQVSETADGIAVTWTNRQPRDGEAAAWQSWPVVSINGVDLPAQLIPLTLADGQTPEIVVERMTSRAWTSRTLPYAATQLPTRTLPDGEVVTPLVATPSRIELPDSPVVLLRQGSSRGQRLAVLAVTPIYAVDGEVREVSYLSFSVAGADSDTSTPISAPLSARTWMLADDVVGPSTVSQQKALKVIVSQAGLQEIVLADVLRAGLIAPAEVDRLQLYLHNEQVALEVDSTAGLLRFYAPKAGDRWNHATIYWLIRGDAAGLRMTQRPATSAAGDTLPLRASGWETGAWSAPTLYISQVAGPDGDFWFTADLRSGPDLPTAAITMTTTLALPPMNASAVMTITGDAYVGATHTLELATGGPNGSTQTTTTWSGSGNWAASFAASADTAQVVATLAADDAPNGVRVDSIEWRRPVALSFDNQGGIFEAGESAARLRLSGLPANFVLYDVTDPRQPVRVTVPEAGATDLSLDTAAARRYLLAADRLSTIYLPNLLRPDSGTRQAATPGSARLDRLSLRVQPALESTQPANWNAALDAEVLYISHRNFLGSLTPLVLARRDQGYDVAVVDVQSIYDGWSGGQISPQAIRSFLRYAAANGSQAPIAATLIGDGTSDPRNYTERNNVTFIPPYLAVVDPWLGETACETCYAQLDGDDPLSDPLMDMMLGRIPVKSAAELDAYIAKLLPYEADLAAAKTRNVMLYVTDNYRQTNGTVDAAGDFTLMADQSIALQPDHLSIDRVYYDPVTATPQQPWRIADAVAAYETTLAKWQQGPGFVTYIGHAHHWQWASTDLNATPPYLLGLYDPDSLRNRADPSIVLGLTCLTGAFQTPAFAGTTIDERILLSAEGGAVAVWGSTGLGVGYGHDSLQTGFYTSLWQSPPGVPMGKLVQGGFLELFRRGLCCQETLRTFSLLGDPLIVPMVGAERYRVYAPVVN